MLRAALIRPSSTPLKIRFPFPLGKGLGVRFLDAMLDEKTISDGTNPPMVIEPSQNHYRWYDA